MSNQTQFPTPLWSASSGRFVRLVFTIGLLVFCVGIIDAFLFADQFQQACAQMPQSTSCKKIETVPEDIRFVTSVQLNVRARPGAEQDILLVIDRNEQVRLLGKSVQVDGGTWVLIDVRSVQGWVNARYLRQ